MRRLRTRVLSGLLKYLQLASNGAANGPQFLCSVLFIKLSPITNSLHITPIFVLSRASLRRALICNRARTSKRQVCFLTYTQDQRSMCSMIITFERCHLQSISDSRASQRALSTFLLEKRKQTDDQTQKDMWSPERSLGKKRKMPVELG